MDPRQTAPMSTDVAKRVAARQLDRQQAVRKAVANHKQEADINKKLQQATKAELRATKKEVQMHKQKLQEIEQKKQAAVEKAKKTRRKNQRKKNA